MQQPDNQPEQIPDPTEQLVTSTTEQKALFTLQLWDEQRKYVAQQNSGAVSMFHDGLVANQLRALELDLKPSLVPLYIKAALWDLHENKDDSKCKKLEEFHN